MVIFVQFTISTLTICVNLYILMGTQITFERIMQLAIYSSCMLTQIYIFCWYGNEVKLKVYSLRDNNESSYSISICYLVFFFILQSLDISNMIFELDWPDLDNSTKRDLLMIMMRASYPIEITSIHVITMNLDSFVIVSTKKINLFFNFLYLKVARERRDRISRSKYQSMIFFFPNFAFKTSHNLLLILNTYSQLLKTSYSAYNLLQGNRE